MANFDDFDLDLRASGTVGNNETDGVPTTIATTVVCWITEMTIAYCQSYGNGCPPPASNTAGHCPGTTSADL